MSAIGIIGGSGLTKLDALVVKHESKISTPYAKKAVTLLSGDLNGLEIVFLPRHGSKHTIVPHKINYRANLWALQSFGIKQVIGVAAVGGIGDNLKPGSICIADQIIDYTYGREHTFFDLNEVNHIDFTEPYCENLRQKIILAATKKAIPLIKKATYGATQGPRLESSAEIKRMKQDGCDLVGMTGMPEASLARELDLCYTNLSLVVNWAAGLGDGPITMQEIEQQLQLGMQQVVQLISAISPNYDHK